MTRDTLWFLASVILLLFSHVLRAQRLAALYPKQYNVRRFDLLLGLALSYAINTVFPFRLGEILRILYVSRRCQIRDSFVAATVIAERLADVIVVGILSGVLLFTPVLAGVSMRAATVAMLAVAAGGILTALGISHSTPFRGLLWQFASIFSNSIRYRLLDLFWSFSELVTGGQIGRSRFLAFTPVMWLFYGLSYFSLAQAVQLPTRDIVLAMLGSPMHSTAASSGILAAFQGEARIFGFTLLPLCIIILYGLLRERTGIFRALNSLASGQFRASLLYNTPISDRFQQPAEYESFLISVFSQRGNILTDFGMTAIADGTVQRLLPGGSDAVTALVEVGDKLWIRKFAIGDAGKKLQTQATWLQQYRPSLPLVDVIVPPQPPQNFFFYDMPYVPAAIDFYEAIHTSTPAESRAVLGSVLDGMLAFHRTTARPPAEPATITRYLAEKATRNAQTILDYSSQWFAGQPAYLLNHREFPLADWHRLLDPQWLAAQITDPRTAVIHGDLTIENIIVSRDHPAGFYIIDPNPENIFDSPLIDWAKLMQSLHLGYEGLNRAPTCTWRNGALSLVLTRSHAYDGLHQFCIEHLRQALGPDAQREIAFHEIINYLRLTPYKIRNTPAKGLAFFACTSILLRDYLETYA